MFHTPLATTLIGLMFVIGLILMLNKVDISEMFEDRLEFSEYVKIDGVSSSDIYNIKLNKSSDAAKLLATNLKFTKEIKVLGGDVYCPKGFPELKAALKEVLSTSLVSAEENQIKVSPPNLKGNLARTAGK